MEGNNRIFERVKASLTQNNKIFPRKKGEHQKNNHERKIHNLNQPETGIFHSIYVQKAR